MTMRAIEYKEEKEEEENVTVSFVEKGWTPIKKKEKRRRVWRVLAIVNALTLGVIAVHASLLRRRRRRRSTRRSSVTLMTGATRMAVDSRRRRAYVATSEGVVEVKLDEWERSTWLLEGVSGVSVGDAVYAATGSSVAVWGGEALPVSACDVAKAGLRKVVTAACDLVNVTVYDLDTRISTTLPYNATRLWRRGPASREVFARTDQGLARIDLEGGSDLSVETEIFSELCVGEELVLSTGAVLARETLDRVGTVAAGAPAAIDDILFVASRGEVVVYDRTDSGSYEPRSHSLTLDCDSTDPTQLHVLRETVGYLLLALFPSELCAQHVVVVDDLGDASSPPTPVPTFLPTPAPTALAR